MNTNCNHPTARMDLNQKRQSQAEHNTFPNNTFQTVLWMNDKIPRSRVSRLFPWSNNLIILQTWLSQNEKNIYNNMEITFSLKKNCRVLEMIAHIIPNEPFIL